MSYDTDYDAEIVVMAREVDAMCELTSYTREQMIALMQVRALQSIDFELYTQRK